VVTDPSARPDPEAMFARLEAMKAEAEATLARFEDMQIKLAEDAVEVVSEDGLVKVKLDGEGKVAEIRIDEHAMRMRQSLSPTIMSLIDEANATYALKSAEMAQAVVGDQFDIMGMVNRDMPQHLRDRARQHLDRDR
jgi:DNA-binding protein YbaB